VGAAWLQLCAAASCCTLPVWLLQLGLGPRPSACPAQCCHSSSRSLGTSSSSSSRRASSQVPVRLLSQSLLHRQQMRRGYGSVLWCNRCWWPPSARCQQQLKQQRHMNGKASSDCAAAGRVDGHQSDGATGSTASPPDEVCVCLRALKFMVKQVTCRPLQHQQPPLGRAATPSAAVADQSDGNPQSLHPPGPASNSCPCCWVLLQQLNMQQAAAAAATTAAKASTVADDWAGSSSSKAEWALAADVTAAVRLLAAALPGQELQQLLIEPLNDIVGSKKTSRRCRQWAAAADRHSSSCCRLVADQLAGSSAAGSVLPVIAELQRTAHEAVDRRHMLV